MNGREIILNALLRKPVPRTPWLPFVGCHGGKIINVSARDYLQSADLIVRGLEKAIERYRPDALPIVFDLQIEAEILGCKLQWADEVPPSVVTHPLADGVALADLPAVGPALGRFPVVTAALDTMKQRYGSVLALYGLICGPFTLALHLLGNDIFLEMLMDPARIRRLMDRCAEIARQSADVYIDHGIDVVAVVDPMTSQISPDHFEEFVAGPINSVFDHIRSRNTFSSIFVCGDVTRNLEVMCKTTADNISVDEQIDMGRLAALARAGNKSFGGNIRLTSVLLLGSEADSKLEAISVMEKSGSEGFILAPGCDLPYGVPEKNLEAVALMVHDEYQRTIAKQTVASDGGDAFADVTLPDYSIENAVIVDVVTLDSTSCAPCQYMMEAVNRAVADSGVRAFVNEHKIKVRQGIGMMVRLGVKNLPTICIDGEVCFSSIIPDHKTLVAAVRSHATRKWT
jgi:MtaA/CmuA family methyltransferase